MHNETRHTNYTIRAILFFSFFFYFCSFSILVIFLNIESMLHLSNVTCDELCEIKEISPFYQLLTEYKNQELMLTVTIFILLLYMEEFLFVFRNRKQNENPSELSISNVAFFHFYSIEYLLVRMGYGRSFLIRITIFQLNNQISIDNS